MHIEIFKGHVTRYDTYLLPTDAINVLKMQGITEDPLLVKNSVIKHEAMAGVDVVIWLESGQQKNLRSINVRRIC